MPTTPYCGALHLVLCNVQQCVQTNLVLSVGVQPGSKLPEDKARWFFQQFVIAVDYMHGLNICHRGIAFLIKQMCRVWSVSLL